MLVSVFLLPTGAEGATTVGGVLASDTTWTPAGNPYIVQSTVQIPEGVTLTIEPGVVVQASSGLTDMFLIHGTLRALGDGSNRIFFDGAGTANFFSAKSSPGTMLVYVEYAEITNGKSLWPPTGFEQYGHLILRHSHISDLSYYSYIWYPQQDVFIEHNTFTNSMGFSVGHRDANVYIRHNRFITLGAGYSPTPSWVENWAAYDSSATHVNQNVFGTLSEGQYAMYLRPGYSSGAMDGTSNYWGTTNTTYVESRIFDKNDDITSAAVIPYQPVLSSEPSEVPPPPPVSLSVTKSGNGVGTITSDPEGITCGETCSASFPMGSSVTLNAIAAQGSEFVGWSGACSGTANCTLSVDDDTTAIAAFALQRMLTVTKSGAGSGTVTTSPGGISCGSDCAEAYKHGTTVTLTATPEPGSEFTGWSGGCSGASSTCYLTLTADSTVTGAFGLQHFSYKRTVSLDLRRHLTAKGSLRSSGPSACAEGVAVVIQRKVDGDWKRVKTTETDDTGAYQVGLRDRAGRYRAVAIAVDLDAQNTCLNARSGVVRHSH